MQYAALVAYLRIDKLKLKINLGRICRYTRGFCRLKNQLLIIMKRISYYFMLLVTMVLCGSLFSACSDDDDAAANLPQLSVNFVTSDATTAKFGVSAQNISECAYLVKSSKDNVAPSKDVIFARGTHFQVSGADNDTLVVPELKPNSNLVLYVAAKDAGKNLLDKVVSVSFSTTDFTEPITIVERKSDGFTVHVKVPESVKANKNAIRFTRGVLPFYNMLKMQGTTDAEMLLSNGGDERSTTDAITYTFDEKNSIIEDPETGETYEIDSPIVPGEPSVFMAGEFSLGESPYGWGEGYYNPLFDTDKYFEEQFGGGGGMLLSFGNEDAYAKELPYWTGFHHRELVYSKQPELLDGGVKVDTVALSPINVRFRFTPDPNVGAYCVFICDDALLNGQVMPLLDNDEKYLQWFTTSFMAFSQLGAQSFSGVNEIDLSDFYEADAIQPDLKFHILVTAMGDESGTKQSFQHLTVVTPQRTKKAPVLEVKGIDNPEGVVNPYEVWFNIKSVGEEKLAKGKYAANYERDTEAMFSNGYDPFRLVDEMGNEFTTEELEEINSPEGLNVRLDSRANACTYMIAVGYNDEGLNSEAIIGKNRSSEIPAADPVDSPYINGLDGDWTASVVLSHYDYTTQQWNDDTEATQFKVTIGNKLSYPETLPEDVYGLYQGMSKEQVDALYSEFKTLSSEYVERLKSQNSILCTGFDILGTEDSQLEAKNPFELFVSKDYNGYNNEALFFDFGPKWFLHISSDGKVSLPINTDYMAPMSNWKTDGRFRETYYLVGVNESGYIGTPSNAQEEWSSFPVEVSENMDTITIQPLKVGSDEDFAEVYYPSPVSMRYGQAVPVEACKSISGITLTKGWNGAKATAKVSRSANQDDFVTIASCNGKSITPMARPLARTIFVKENQKVNCVKYGQRVSPEAFKAGMLKLANQWLKGQQKK